MNLRKQFSNQLSGIGIEIGALHAPMEKHAGMDVKYVDRLSKAALQEQYPELQEFDIVEPDILENAETLHTIASDQLDFVIASHLLEHCKNPIGAIKNWLRVLKPGGKLYLVVPDYRLIFDKFRKETSLTHMLRDYDWNDDEMHALHYQEYAELVNKKFFGRDIDVMDEALRLEKQEYSIHFHCFTPDSLHELLKMIRNTVIGTDIEWAYPIAEGIEFHTLITKLEK